MGSNLPPIPPGFHTITPSLVGRDADAAITLYKHAFGAEEVLCLRMPSGAVMHAELKIGDSIFMLGGGWPAQGMKSPVAQHVTGGLHVYVTDVDRAFQRALDAGCSALMPPQNMFWGDRFAKVLDMQGHVWSLATRIEDVSPEECERRAAAWRP